ncbi:MAG: ChbG/HpnK family deacetylase [Burkholderiaceae bacterium]
MHGGGHASDGDEPEQTSGGLQRGHRRDRGHGGSPDHDTPICVCADDFGLHAGVNKAVLSLVALGRVNAVSVMVGAPASREGVDALNALVACARPDIGLHLDLTQHPIGSSSRRSLGGLIATCRIWPAERRVRAEITAQLDRFEDMIGRAPDFVDGHQHVHQLPGVREVLLGELSARYGNRPWIRHTRGPQRACADESLLSRLKTWVIERTGANGLAREACRKGFALNARLLGVYGFDTDDEGFLRLLGQWLAIAHEGDLLMCHPGIPGTGGDAIGAARYREYLMLSDIRFAQLLAEMRITLRPLSRILATGRMIR